MLNDLLLNSARSSWAATRIRHTRIHKQESRRRRHGSIACAFLSPLLPSPLHSIRSDRKTSLNSHAEKKTVKGRRETEKAAAWYLARRRGLSQNPTRVCLNRRANCNTGGPLLGSQGLLIFQKNMACYQGKHSCSKINKVKDAVRRLYTLRLSCGPSR